MRARGPDLKNLEIEESVYEAMQERAKILDLTVEQYVSFLVPSNERTRQ